jgi:hypothetical protein
LHVADAMTSGLNPANHEMCHTAHSQKRILNSHEAMPASQGKRETPGGCVTAFSMAINTCQRIILETLHQMETKRV